jgi:NHL repeat
VNQAGVFGLRFWHRRTVGVLFALLATLILGTAPAVAATGGISTVAGNGVAGFWGDGGLATSASLRAPTGIAFAPDGTMYIADAGDHGVRKVSPLGLISTFAGTGSPGNSGDDGGATAAQLNTPVDVAVDASGAVCIADYGNHVIRKVSTSGVITRFAGTGTAGYSGNGGQARWAQLRNPLDLDVGRGRGAVAAGNRRVGRRSRCDGERRARHVPRGRGGPASARRCRGWRAVRVQARPAQSSDGRRRTGGADARRLNHGTAGSLRSR